mmetsp:Transcript_20014/g.22890  ORF Transcript_20014/g.22890 Transcript_20014/m.22890 type:complete len:263 (-) Transcript_20014:143-931(-)
MADVQYWDDMLTQEIDELNALINDEIPAITNDDSKSHAINQAESKLKSASKTKKTLKMETRLVTDTQSRKCYEDRHSRLDENLSHLKADLSALKQDFERARLGLMQGSDVGNPYEMSEEDGQRAGDQMLGEAHRLQDKTQDALENTKQMVNEAKEVGMSSLEELKRQRETMDRIDQDTDRIDTALDVAEKLIKNFGKRMASDRFIQCFTLLNVILLIVVIIFAATRGGTTNEQVTPENPLTPISSPGDRKLRSANKTPDLYY